VTREGGAGPPQWVVRPAASRDVVAIQAIEVDAGARFRTVGLDAVADDPPPTAERLLAHIKLGTAWVGAPPGADDESDVPVGYAMASVVDGEGHLDQVSVLGRAQGRGVGAALVRHVLAWSAAEGHPAVTLTTYRDLPWNGPWYVHLGFRAVPGAALGPDLASILIAERPAGLEPPTRIVVRRPADP